MNSNNSFQVLPPAAEEMLKIILEHQENFPDVLVKIFKNEIKMSATYSDERLRSIISKLIDTGMISKLSWADNLPYYGRIEEDGYNYFTLKESKEREKSSFVQINDLSNSTFTNSIVTIGNNNIVDFSDKMYQQLEELEQEITKPMYNLTKENIEDISSYIDYAKIETKKNKKKLALNLIIGIWSFVKDLGCQVLAAYIASKFSLN